jgi:signal transduction histidine kinase
MRGEVVRSEEIEWRGPNSKYQFLAISSAPIRDDTERIVSVVAMFFDVTRRHAAEDMHLVSEQMAATGRLAASLSHEINNPLESLTNVVYLLRRQRNLDTETRKYVEMVQVELERISHISNSLLGLYRKDAPADTFLVRAVINDVVNVFAPRIAAARILVVKRYEAEGEVHGYYTELRQIILNLIGNALDAMKHGGQLIVRTSASRDWRNAKVKGFRITVIDTGCGMSRELQHRLFEPFFTTKGNKGTGLGLWVSRGIVQRYGGNIHCRSRTDPGKSGSCFTVFLPNPMVRRSEKSPKLRRQKLTV